MPGIDIGVADTTQATGIVGVDVALRPSGDESTTTTADPGTAGTTLAVTSAAKFPTGNGSYVRVDDEYMLVTAGAGTTSWTVTRNVVPPGTTGGTGVAHSIGATVNLMVAVQRVSPVYERVTLFDGMLAGFRTLGTAAVPQNLFTIENGASAGALLVAVKRLSVEMDATAALLTVAPEFLVTRPTALPTGGTPMTKGGQDTALTSNAGVVIRSATASDGGAATAITATAGAARLWHQFQMRMATQVGQMLGDDENLLPMLVEGDPLILRASQALLVQVIGTAASNAATNHYVCKVAWEEYKLP
jgi:hypothetical protein